MLLLPMIFLFFNDLDACIPTQNIESTTTTTTTTTEAPFPCNVCSKVYETSCQGPNLPSASNWCSTEKQVPVTYTLGMNSEVLEYACYSELSCPAGTTALFSLIDNGGDSPGNDDGSPTLVYCPETGPDAGKWFVYLSLEVHTYDIDVMRCQNV